MLIWWSQVGVNASLPVSKRQQVRIWVLNWPARGFADASELIAPPLSRPHRCPSTLSSPGSSVVWPACPASDTCRSGRLDILRSPAVDTHTDTSHKWSVRLFGPLQRQRSTIYVTPHLVNSKAIMWFFSALSNISPSYSCVTLQRWYHAKLLSSGCISSPPSFSVAVVQHYKFTLNF